MPFDAKYATLCLLITYHWHASWAVSTWPSGGAGIAAEVNGSPTDARLNIPVVKRSSNQAKLANEPPRPGVVHGDSPGRLVQGGGLSESTVEGYPSPAMEGTIRLEDSWKGTIEGSSDDAGDGLQDDGKKWPRDDDEGKGTSRARSFDHRTALASTRAKRQAEEAAEDKNGTTIERSKIGVFDVGRTDSSEARRKVPLVNVARLGAAGPPRRREADESQDTANPYKASIASQTSNPREDAGKGPAGSPGISLGVAKLLDSSRLHQQSRNTKPRTIVQHLRGERQTNDHSSRSDVGSRLYERPVDQRRRRQQSAQPVPSFTKFNGNPNQLRFIPLYGHYATKNPKSFGPRGINGNRVDETLADSYRSGRQNVANLSTLENDIEDLRDSLSGVFDRHLGPERIRELPNVRAILPKQVFVASPRLIYDTKILPAPFSLDKYFQSLGTGDSSSSDRKSNQLGSSVKGVFDPEGIVASLEERPGKSMALSSDVDCPIPDISEKLPDDSPDCRTENCGTSRVSFNSFHRFSATATREDPKESISSQNFVTSLPPDIGFPFGVNQLRVSSLVSTRPDGTYKVRGLEEPKIPSRLPQPETFQRDIDEPSLDRKSPSGTGENPSGDTSGHDSASTHAGSDESGPGSVDQSIVIGAINDEYANHESHSRAAGSGVPTRGSPKRGQQRDHRYNEGTNNWRGRDDNDHTRYVAKYKFGYLVNDDDSHNDFGHQEMRDEGITKGRYHVRLPDGRIQRVNYQVDDSGYHAVVSYRHESQ